MKCSIKRIRNNLRIKRLRQKGVKIGDGCDIHKSVSFGTEPYLITIGNNVRITNGCKLFCHDGSLWVLRNLKLVDQNADKVAPIRIGNNVNIGWDVTIMPGIHIGDNVIIGAGSIITKDIPSNTVVAGIPAKVINTIDGYYKKVKDKCVNTKGMDRKRKKQYILNLYEGKDEQ